MTKRNAMHSIANQPTNRIRIGSQDFTVIFRHFDKHNKLCGHMDPLSLTIEIDDTGNKAVAFQTFIHEVLHVICDETMTGYDESKVERVSRVLSRFLRDNRSYLNRIMPKD